MTEQTLSQLDYELTNDDFVAFGVHAWVTNSGTGQRKFPGRTATSLLAGVLPLVVVGGLYVAGGLQDPVAALVFTLSSVCLTVGVSWFAWPASVRRGVRRQMAGTHQGTAGRYHLEWTEAGVRQDGPRRTLSATWSQVLRVDETPEYLLLYLNDLEALIVPKRVGPGVSDLTRVARERV